MVEIKSSRSISDLKKGDKLNVDGVVVEVDDYGILMEHKNTSEMFIDIFDPKTDKDYQLRYFENNLEMSLELYELQGEILYVKKEFEKIEW